MITENDENQDYNLREEEENDNLKFGGR